MSSKQEDARRFVVDIAAAIKRGELGDAAKLLAEGRKIVGEDVIDPSGQNVWKIIDMRLNRAGATQKANAVRPVSAPPAPVAAPEVPVVDATAELCLPGGPADGGVSLGTITIVHDAARGTYTQGSDRSDGSYAIMTGDRSQHWNYRRGGVAAGVRYPGRYGINKTKGLAPLAERIGYATMALRRGGFTVLHNIDATLCAPRLSVSAIVRQRNTDARIAAMRQDRVTPGIDANEPVSAPPAQTAAPESVAPVAPAQPVEVAPALPSVAEWVAPVQAVPVAEVSPFADLTDTELLYLVVQGDTAALAFVKARMLANAEVRVAEIAAPPVAETVPVLAAPEVPAIAHDGYVEVWFASTVATKGQMREAAPIARGVLASRAAKLTTGDGHVTTHIACVAKEKAFKVYAEVPAGIDPAQVVELITATLPAFAAFGEVREPAMTDA